MMQTGKHPDREGSWRKVAPQGETHERVGGRERREEREKGRVKERV